MVEISKKTLKNIFLGIIGCIVLYWFLIEGERVKAIIQVIKNVIAPFFVGAAIAFVVNVPMRSIEGVLGKIKNSSLRRTVALLLTAVIILLVLALVFWLLVPQLIDTVQSLIPKLYTFAGNVETGIKSFMNENPKVMAWIIENTDIENFEYYDKEIFEELIDPVLMAGGGVNYVNSDMIVWREEMLKMPGQYTQTVSDDYYMLIQLSQRLYNQENFKEQISNSMEIMRRGIRRNDSLSVVYEVVLEQLKQIDDDFSVFR